MSGPGKSGVTFADAGRAIPENACESAGLQRIIALMRRSHFEVMLVYIPDDGNPGQCQWIEIGRGEYGDRAEDVSVDVDREYLAQLMRDHHRLHLYHYHPLVYFEQCTDDVICKRPTGPTNMRGGFEKALISNVRYSMPSPIDIAFMMDISREFDEYHHGGGKIRNRVVTPYGIVEYSLTEEGKDRLESDGMEGEAGRFGFDTYMKTRISYALSDVGAILEKHPNDMRRALGHVARGLSNEYLRVTYVSFDRDVLVPTQGNPRQRRRIPRGGGG
ncbi:MAG: hypothetical protein ACE5IQ_06435 [Candidatus Methylomirabilales bacterium]